MIKRIKRFFIKIILIVLCLCAVGGFCFYKYVDDYYHASASTIALINEDKEITVDRKNDTIVVNAPHAKAGIIFYPGGKVEAEAYIPLMKELAKKDILCIIKIMPFRLAVLDIDGANGIKEKYGKIKDWYMAGHSLGGAMASSYIKKNISDYKGLILLGAYSTDDISHTNLNVITIYGSEDKVLSKSKYKKCLSNLPENYHENIIDGGCHSYFGDYGHQKGDGNPTISRDEQIYQVANYISYWI